MPDIDLTNCRFIVEKESIEVKTKILLLLLGQGFKWLSGSQALPTVDYLVTLNYIWVENSTMWRSNEDYAPYRKLPIIDNQYFISNY